MIDLKPYKTKKGYNNWVFIAEYPMFYLFYNTKRNYRECFFKNEEPHETINHYD